MRVLAVSLILLLGPGFALAGPDGDGPRPTQGPPARPGGGPPEAAPGPQPEQGAGVVWGRTVSAGEFRAKLALLRDQVDSKTTEASLWRRIAILQAAERKGLRVSAKLRQQELERIVLGWAWHQAAAKQLGGSPATAMRLRGYAEAYAAAKERVKFSNSLVGGLLKARGLERPQFLELIAERLMLRMLARSLAVNPALAVELRQRKAATKDRVMVEAYELRPGADLDPGFAPEEAVLRAHFTEEETSFREWQRIALSFAFVAQGEGARELVTALRERWTKHPELSVELLVERDSGAVSAFGAIPETVFDRLPEPRLRDRNVAHWIERLTAGEMTPVMTVADGFMLVRCESRRGRRRPRFSEARRRVAADLARIDALARTLARAQRLARGLPKGAAAAAAALDRAGAMALGTHRFGAGLVPDYGLSVLADALRAEPGWQVRPDMDFRRVLIWRVVSRERGKPSLETLSKAELTAEAKRAYRAWTTKACLAANGIGSSQLADFERWLAPRSRVWVRFLALKPSPRRERLRREFEAGRSHRVITAQIGSGTLAGPDKGRLSVLVAGPLSGAVELLRPGQVSRVFSQGTKTLRVFCVTRRDARGRPKARFVHRLPAKDAALDAELAALGSAEEREARLLAASREAAPEAGRRAGLLGVIPAAGHALAVVLRGELAGMQAGERRVTEFGEKLLFLEVLERRKSGPKARQRALEQFEGALKFGLR